MNIAVCLFEDSKLLVKVPPSGVVRDQRKKNWIPEFIHGKIALPGSVAFVGFLP